MFGAIPFLVPAKLAFLLSLFNLFFLYAVVVIKRLSAVMVVSVAVFIINVMIMRALWRHGTTILRIASSTAVVAPAAWG